MSTGQSLISEKMKTSIYVDYPEYKEYPFSTTKRFGVHYYKRYDLITGIISRHEAKRNGKQAQSIAPALESAVHAPQNIFESQAPHQEYNPHCEHYHELPQPPAQLRDSGKARDFRIYGNRSRADSVYSADTNTLKSVLHGDRFGYYKNRPLAHVGAGYGTGRSGQSHHRGGCGQSGNFSETLLTDPRTGQKMEQRAINGVVSTILRESKVVEESPPLQEGILHLKDSGSLQVHKERINKVAKVMEKRYCDPNRYNKHTKNGYVRNNFGGLFYKD